MGDFEQPPEGEFFKPLNDPIIKYCLCYFSTHCFSIQFPVHYISILHIFFFISLSLYINSPQILAELLEISDRSLHR